MKHVLLAAGCVALALAACQKKSDAVVVSDTSAVAASAPAPPSASEFVAKAAASDMYEVQAAKIAQKRSKNADVVGFAKKMEADHTQSTEMVQKAIVDAGRTDLKPPPDLPADKQSMIDALNKAPDGDFDKTYLDQQAMAHQDALALMTAESQTGDVPQLKDAAAKILPVVEMHVDMLSKMAAK